jgi:transcriptional regulator with XRE-family HTH domain
MGRKYAPGGDIIHAAVPKKPQSTEGQHPEVGEQLRAAAEKLGLSQNQLSKLSGVSRKHIGVAFRGDNISLTLLKKLVTVLKMKSVSLGDLEIVTERKTVNPHLVEHARVLLDRAANDVRDAAEMLRDGNFSEHAGRLVRQVVSESRRAKGDAAPARRARRGG